MPPGVAPSQGRGSKQLLLTTTRLRLGRPLTGARIETFRWIGGHQLLWSPPHRGADRNPGGAASGEYIFGRPLTGARIETRADRRLGRAVSSPPHRGADRNRPEPVKTAFSTGSPPHRGADRNSTSRKPCAVDRGRPLTGARIETAECCSKCTASLVAPSQGRGSKPSTRSSCASSTRSPPHRGADRNAIVASKVG